jgi:hypothetical protein
MMPDVDCGLCHASAIHISSALLSVSRKSWNLASPTSNTRATLHSARRKFVFTFFDALSCHFRLVLAAKEMQSPFRKQLKVNVLLIAPCISIDESPISSIAAKLSKS